MRMSSENGLSMELNDLRIECIGTCRIVENSFSGEEILPQFDKELNEEGQAFKTLVDDLSKKLAQSERDLKCGNYYFKEHCNEIRRRVQLSKELIHAGGFLELILRTFY